MLKLRDNRAVNNGEHGIRLMGSRNQVKSNVADDNLEDGIRVDGTGTGNEIQGNRTHGNGAAFAGIRIMTGSTDSKIEGNEARGNGMDLIDENGACSDNTWQGNAFVTRSQTCITAPKAFAANLTVNSAADDDDGSCDAAPGDCTLREAIDDLNAGLGSSIGFDPATFPPGILTPIAVASASARPHGVGDDRRRVGHPLQ